MPNVKLRRSEFEALLVHRDVDLQLEELNQSGLLAEVFPEVHAMVGFGGGKTGHKDLWGHTKQVVKQVKHRVHLRWAALFHDTGKPHCFTRAPNGEVSFHNHEAKSMSLFRVAWSRMPLMSRDDRDRVSALIYNLGHVEAYESEWKDSAVRRLHTLVGNHFDDLLALARADITTKHAHKRDAHLRRLKELRERAEALASAAAILPALPTGLGNRVTEAFGVPPSPELGKVLSTLTAVVEAGHLPRQAAPQILLDYIRANPAEFPTVKVTT